MRQSSHATFGDVLRRYRIEAGLTQEALAELSGVSVPSISNIERGIAHVARPQTVQLLAAALKLSTADREALNAAAGQQRTALRGDHTTGSSGPAPLLVEGVPLPASVLPQPTTPFLGRETEVHEICALLEQPTVRLVTLTGLGGVGKTRVALAVAGKLGTRFPSGTPFVSLAPLTDPALVLATIAHQVGVPDTGDRLNQESALRTYLHDKQLLLVLDNFEHLLPAAPSITALLASCPDLKVLVTSRSHLHVSGEYEYPILPLPLPPRDYLPPIEALALSPAVLLFVQRAQAADPAFALTAGNAPSVAALCAHLDGLPLAIELAAARSKLFTPAVLLRHLQQQPLHLLSDGPQDVPARQQTLRATLDWSYALLREDEQQVFRRLAVFHGGCTVEAAEAICSTSTPRTGHNTGGDEHHDSESLDVTTELFALLDHHLVERDLGVPRKTGSAATTETDDEEPRVALLETVRQYALELVESTGERDSAQQEHARFFLAFAEVAEPALRGPEQQRWLTWLERDYANLRAALLERLRRRDAAHALRIAGALGRYWWLSGYLTEGRDLLERAVALAEETDDVQETPWYAKALHNAGLIVQRMGDHDQAISYYEAALARYRLLGEDRGAAGTLNNLGTIARERGDLAQAMAYYSDCLTACRVAGDEWGCAIALTNLGTVAQDRGNYADAATCYEESLALRRRLHDTRGISVALAHLADLACARGDAAQAAAWCDECLALRRQLGDRWGIAEALDILANSMRLRHDLSQAGPLARESVSLGREIADAEVLAFSLTTLAHIEREQGARAQSHTTYDEALQLQLRVDNTHGIAACLEGIAALACGVVDGRGGIDETAEVTRTVAEDATQLVAAATAMREIAGIQRTHLEQRTSEATTSQLHMALSAEEFSSVWRRGETLTRERILEYAQRLLLATSRQVSA